MGEGFLFEVSSQCVQHSPIFQSQQRVIPMPSHAIPMPHIPRPMPYTHCPFYFCLVSNVLAALLEVLRSQSLLFSLDLSCNEITDCGAALLVDALEDNEVILDAWRAKWRLLVVYWCDRCGRRLFDLRHSELWSIIMFQLREHICQSSCLSGKDNNERMICLFQELSPLSLFGMWIPVASDP